MKKFLVLLSTGLGLLLLVNTASADLKSDAIQSNDPKVLVKYLNSTKAGQNFKVKKATYTQENYLVLVLKKKPKLASLAQREKFSSNVQKTMNTVPQNFVKSGIAFYQGGSDGANLIIAFDANKVFSSKYATKVRNSSLGDLGKGTTACYFEPIFAQNDGNGAFESSPSTQRKNAGPDGETLIETIQDVTE